MRNIPFFTTENGVATLVLKEIPYKGEGYILVHGANKMEALLAECAELLRACGANRIFARGEGPPMAQAAAAAGADGIMVEVHNNPACALCDGAQSLTPAQFDEVARKVRRVREAIL